MSRSTKTYLAEVCFHCRDIFPDDWFVLGNWNVKRRSKEELYSELSRHFIASNYRHLVNQVFGNIESYEFDLSYLKETSRSSSMTVERDKGEGKIAEGCFGAFRLAILASFKRVPDRLVRFFNNRFMTCLLEDPEGIRRQLKELALVSDRKYFNLPAGWSEDNIFRVLDPWLSGRVAAQFRTVGRSLPHAFDVPDVQEYVDRVSAVPLSDLQTEDEFAEWFDELLESVPDKEENYSSISVSNSGSIERPRSSGGQCSFYPDIIEYQSRRLLGNTPRNKFDDWLYYDEQVMNFLRDHWIICHDVRGPSASDCLGSLGRLRPRPGCLDRLELRCVCHSYREDNRYKFMNKDQSICRVKTMLLIGGSMNLLGLFKPNEIPLEVLVTKERGGKFRLPTKTTVPLLVIAGLLRNPMNHILKTWPWAGNGLRGQVPVPWKSQGAAFIRSVDLTNATDNHSYRLSRQIYLKLINKGVCLDFTFPFYRDILDICLPEKPSRPILFRTGPKEFPAFDAEIRMVTDPLWSGMFMNKTRLFTQSGIHYDTLPEQKKRERVRGYPSEINTRRLRATVLTYEEKFLEFHNGLLDYKIGIARKGPPMGEPLAWPILPLVTRFAWVTSNHHGRLETFGDDARFRTTRKKSKLFDNVLTRLGSSPSKDKDRLHPSRSVFTEFIDTDGERAGSIPLGWALPSQGKGSQNWWTYVPSGFRLSQDHSCPKWVFMRLIQQSPFYRELLLAERFGMPVTLPTSVGGVGLPHELRRNRAIPLLCRIVPLLESMEDGYEFYINRISVPAYSKSLLKVMKGSIDRASAYDSPRSEPGESIPSMAAKLAVPDFAIFSLSGGEFKSMKADFRPDPREVGPKLRIILRDVEPKRQITIASLDSELSRLTALRTFSVEDELKYPLGVHPVPLEQEQLPWGFF